MEEMEEMEVMDGTDEYCSRSHLLTARGPLHDNTQTSDDCSSFNKYPFSIQNLYISEHLATSLQSPCDYFLLYPKRQAEETNLEDHL